VKKEKKQPLRLATLGGEKEGGMDPRGRKKSAAVFFSNRHNFPVGRQKREKVANLSAAEKL